MSPEIKEFTPQSKGYSLSKLVSKQVGIYNYIYV